jgi:hypothetical protein
MVRVNIKLPLIFNATFIAVNLLTLLALQDTLQSHAYIA